MAEKKYNIIELQQARMGWKNVLEDCLSEDERRIFISRKKAVDMYIDGYKLSEITSESGLSKSQVVKMIHKCVKRDILNNHDYGYRGLLPYKHLKNYQRRTDSIGEIKGFSGSLSKLFTDYPSLSGFIYNNLFEKKDNTLEKNIKPTILHRKFLEECKRLGIQSYEYPFNTSNKGSRSLRDYISNLLKENENEAINREHKDAKQKFESTGFGLKHSPSPIAPYSFVQLDGHKIDMLYSIEIENKHGEMIRRTATRAWIIAVIDVATRVILGYTITPNENYNQTDVLVAIKDSIIPKRLDKLTIPGFYYPDNGGFPSTAIPCIKWAMFDNIMLDNAKSHLAKDVVQKLTQKLKCSVNFGSVATPETRGIVERMFKTIEENGFHRMPSTTGSNILDKKRKHAETNALKYQISLTDIEQMTEYFIAIYNNSPHSSLDNETPLQRMERRVIQAGMIPYIAKPEDIEIIDNLTNILITRTIRGGYNSGKKPYITYLGVEYRNNIIPLSMSLIGQIITLEVNPSDISYVKAYFKDGSELGILSATGEWGRKSHSIKTRMEVMKFSKENSENNSPFYAPLSEFENELRKRASNSRRAGTKNSIIKREQNKYVHEEIQTLNKPEVERKNDNLITQEKREVKYDTYSPDIEKLLLSMSIEEAFEKGLL